MNGEITTDATGDTPDGTETPGCAQCRRFQRIARHWEGRAKRYRRQRADAEARANDAERRLIEICKIVDR